MVSRSMVERWLAPTRCKSSGSRGTSRYARRGRSRETPPALFLRVLRPSKAVLGVIVDESARLHVRVADGRPDELEATPEQLLAQRVRFSRLRGDILQGPTYAAPGRTVHEAPDERVERAELTLHSEKSTRVRNE